MSLREPTPLTLKIAAGSSSADYSGKPHLRCRERRNRVRRFLVGRQHFYPVRLGMNVFADNDFQRAKFRNPTGGELNARVVVGFWTYDDKRFHVVGDGAEVLVANTTPISVEEASHEVLQTTMLTGVKTAATQTGRAPARPGTSASRRSAKAAASGLSSSVKPTPVSTSNFGALLSPALSEYLPAARSHGRR